MSEPRTRDRPDTAPPAAHAVRRRSIDLARLRFPILVAGPDDGELVMLLHGFPQTAETWRPLLPDLAEVGRHAVAPLQRGYAPTARPRNRWAYGINHLMNDVLGLADALGASRFDLVGHD